MAHLNVTASYKIPPNVGPENYKGLNVCYTHLWFLPTNAPNAKTDVQSPETSPYVSIVSGKPALIADLCASENPPTTEAPSPNPCIVIPTMMETRLFLIGRYLKGP